MNAHALQAAGSHVGGQLSRKVLVTGGAGYIGSHAVLELLAAGYEPLVVDNLSRGVRSKVPPKVPFFLCDIGDRNLISDIIRQHTITSVMHFAGSIIVPESIENPVLYYRNNTTNSLALIDLCVALGVQRFVFSSSAAVYGVPKDDAPVSEDAATEPISPYGASKLMTEWMLRDACRAHPEFRAVCLRYFNVAGSDPQGRTGPARNATHLIRVAVDTALGLQSRLEIFGDDYPTRDGTCERDYIHVTDLAAAHRQALGYLEAGGEYIVVNCGYGRGATVREVVACLERLTGKALPVAPVARRPGDAHSVVANVSRLKALFDWRPRHDSLEEILRSTLAWRTREMASAAASAGALQ
jgi:UDP-glucose 4-epimerase